MASRNATVAEAAKDALNTAAANPVTFGRSFTAIRVYSPVAPLNVKQEMRVTVYAPGDSQQQATRNHRQYEIPVLIGMECGLTPSCDPTAESGNTEIDALMEFAEKVADFFKPGPLGDSGASFLRTDLKLQNPDVMREQRLFTAVATVFFNMLTL